MKSAYSEVTACGIKTAYMNLKALLTLFQARESSRGLLDFRQFSQEIARILAKLAEALKTLCWPDACCIFGKL
jgi:hypothetical protein